MPSFIEIGQGEWQEEFKNSTDENHSPCDFQSTRISTNWPNWPTPPRVHEEAPKYIVSQKRFQLNGLNVIY